MSRACPLWAAAAFWLDKYLFAIDLDRQKNCYIANIVKCRPPQNRDPLPAESEACMPWLREQFRLLRPRSWSAWAGWLRSG